MYLRLINVSHNVLHHLYIFTLTNYYVQKSLRELWIFRQLASPRENSSRTKFRGPFSPFRNVSLSLELLILQGVNSSCRTISCVVGSSATKYNEKVFRINRQNFCLTPKKCIKERYTTKGLKDVWVQSTNYFRSPITLCVSLNRSVDK